jgi:hypothetical protein
MRKRFGAWVLLLLLLHLLLPASLPELDAPPIEENALQTSQSSPISIISFQTDPSPVFVGQNFTYKVKVKNSGDEPVTIAPLINERFDPPDSVIIVEDYRPRIFVIPIELHPGEVVELDPFALFSARRVGEVRITVDVSWSYSGDPGSWHIASGNFSFMVYESHQELMKKFGELVVGIGELEEKVGSFDQLLKEFKDVSFWQTMALKLEKDPEFSARFGVLLAKTVMLYPTLQKKFSDLSPSEKVGLGKSIIEISELMEEIIQQGE